MGRTYDNDRNVLRIENGISSDNNEEEIFTAEEAINGSGTLGTFQAKLIVFCGFIWMARGADEILISFIGQLISCDWYLERWQTATVTTGSLFFSTVGCIMYGIWSDKYGRRAALSSSLIFFFIFGAVSAGLPSYIWYVIFQMGSAFSAGGLPQAWTLVSELTPTARRGRTIYILSVFWAVGIVGMIALLYSTAEPPQNWRTFVALSSIPSCISMVVMKFFPESVRFLLISNEDLAANIIMEEIATANKQNLPKGVMEPAVQWKGRGNFSYFFSRAAFRTTLLFWFIGFATATSYWGLTIIVPIIIGDGGNDANVTVSDKNFLGDIYTQVECLPNITHMQFIEIVWTSALDFPGVLVYLILIDIINRKVLLEISCTISALFIFLLYIPMLDLTVKTAFLYCSKTLLIPQFDLLLLMLSEAYPTTHRGSAIGLGVSTFYIGLFLNPYIYQAIGKLEYAMGFYGCLSLLAALAGTLLPLETRGRELMEIPDQE